MTTEEKAFMEKMRICTRKRRDKALQQFTDANAPNQRQSQVKQKIRQAAELGLYRTPFPLSDASVIHTHQFTDAEILEALQSYTNENSYGLRFYIQRNSQGMFEELQMDWQDAPSAHATSSSSAPSPPDKDMPQNRRSESGYRT